MDNRRQPSHDWLSHLVTATTVGVLLVTAVVVRPGIDALLLIGMMLCGGGALLHALIRWGNRRWSPFRSLCVGTFGVLLLLFAALEMSLQPEGMPAMFRTAMMFVLMLPVVMLMRERSRNASPT